MCDHLFLFHPPSIAHPSRLQNLVQAEVEDLQRQESSLLAGSHPPAPAPPPTPVHSTLVGNVFGTDVNAAVDCMDVVIEEDTGPYTFAMPTSNDMMLGAEPSTSGAHPLGLPPLPPLTVNTVGGHAGDHGTASSPTAGALCGCYWGMCNVDVDGNNVFDGMQSCVHIVLRWCTKPV